MRKKSILFVGHCYYNHWYLSRELRKIGWKADVINTDLDPQSSLYYHGQDYTIKTGVVGGLWNLWFFLRSLVKYRIFHFANVEGIYFPPFKSIPGFYRVFGHGAEIRILKLFNKKIFYTNNGCRDGVTQTSFNKWGPYAICDICAWKNMPNICSDEKNIKWGVFRNSVADFIGILGGNRTDFNTALSVHEAPWVYCIDKNFWNPKAIIPGNYLLPFSKETIKIYHSVGNYDTRSHGDQKQTIKSTAIWVEIIERLKLEGYSVELIFFKDVPNKQLKYYQLQADIFVDMLSFGFFGANIREAMMLGKPAICFLRPEWMESMRNEIPEYVDELPVISANPETAYETLKELVINTEKRENNGKAMRAFGLKWHASDVSAKQADVIYSSFLK